MQTMDLIIIKFCGEKGAYLYEMDALSGKCLSRIFTESWNISIEFYVNRFLTSFIHEWSVRFMLLCNFVYFNVDNRIELI